MADTKSEQQKQIDAQVQAFIAQLVAAGLNLGGTTAKTPTNVSATTTSKGVTKLTPASAEALLKEAAAGIQYTGKFTKAEIDDFIKQFDAEQAAQIETVVKTVTSKVTPGASPEAVQKEITTSLQTDYPSFFKPAETAKNYLWAKVNFKQPETLGGANLQVLQQVQQAVKDFNLLGVSEAESLAAAKDIAMGKMSIGDYKAKLSLQAQKEFPNLANRFASTPGLTTRDIATPIINMLAKEWEVDPASIGLDNPIVINWLHPKFANGKEVAYSYTDALRDARNDPKWQETTAANESARDAATSMARAFGFGV